MSAPIPIIGAAHSSQVDEAAHYNRPALWMTWLLGAAMLAAVIGLALHFTDAESFAGLLTQVQPLWLAAAVAVQVLTYVAQGQIFAAY